MRGYLLIPPPDVSLNLLAWRPLARRRALKRIAVYGTIWLAGGLIALLLAWRHHAPALAIHTADLHKATKLLASSKASDALTSQLSITTTSLVNRQRFHYLLAQLQQHQPSELWLQSVELGDRALLRGSTPERDGLTQLMRSLESADGIAWVQLREASQNQDEWRFALEIAINYCREQLCLF